MNEFSKNEYKIQIQIHRIHTKFKYTNSLHFYIRLRKQEKDKENSPFTLQPKRKTTKKGRNVTKKVKELSLKIIKHG